MLMDARVALGALPEWDLSDLYPAPDGPEISADFSRLEDQATAFAKTYEGRIAALDGRQARDAAFLAAAIADYEALQALAGRLGSYAGLLYATALDDPKVGQFHQSVEERLNTIGAGLLFFQLEISRLPEAALARLLKGKKLAHYQPWLRDVRAWREHQLSDELERFSFERDITGRAAWVRLFDETSAALRYPVGGKSLTGAEVQKLLSDKNPKIRKKAGAAMAGVFRDHVRLFALITNTLAKDKEIEDRWRAYPTPEASRHLANHVEPEVVEALVGAVKAAYPALSHRYYTMKAAWLGKDKLPFWDRNAPLPGDDDRLIAWDEAREVVLGAYRAFSPRLAEIGERFFTNRWIDAPLRPGKDAGAFAHPTVPGVHPYLLLNYQGKPHDVMTLAHELGHGVHQVLAAPRGALMAPTPLTLAETASVFGEMLTFRALLAAEANPARRRVLLAAKVEDMLNTVVRQIAFHDFESRLHAARRKAELTPDEIAELWMATQRESLGPAFELGDGYENFWCHVPHFIHTPFYVYAYAFGDCLVNSLISVFDDQPDGFEQKYLDLLRAGGTARHRELLAPFGLNAADPAFWARGLSLIERFIDDLENHEPR
jgi:oligoendopeptidase F